MYVMSVEGQRPSLGLFGVMNGVACCPPPDLDSFNLQLLTFWLYSQKCKDSLSRGRTRRDE